MSNSKKESWFSKQNFWSCVERWSEKTLAVSGFQSDKVRVVLLMREPGDQTCFVALVVDLSPKKARRLGEDLIAAANGEQVGPTINEIRRSFEEA